MLIDTHAHVNFNVFKDDADEVIKRSLSSDTWMILVGSEYKTSKRALDYANKYEGGVYAAVGMHPIHLEEIRAEDENGEYNFQTHGEDFNYDIFEQLAKFNKVVAIGETGLDYYHINLAKNVSVIKERQRIAFIEQMLLARHLDLPIIIHCRNAHDDMLSVLTEFRKKYKHLMPSDRPWGVMHCFSGDEDLAWKYFSLGIIISFTGIVTFSRQWDDLIRKLPLDKFMIETDCPYLTPEPFRGQRNEPTYVKYIAERIALIKNVEVKRVIETSTENARKFFKI